MPVWPNATVDVERIAPAVPDAEGRHTQTVATTTTGLPVRLTHFAPGSRMGGGTVAEDETLVARFDRTADVRKQDRLVVDGYSALVDGTWKVDTVKLPGLLDLRVVCSRVSY